MTGKPDLKALAAKVMAERAASQTPAQPPALAVVPDLAPSIESPAPRPDEVVQGEVVSNEPVSGGEVVPVKPGRHCKHWDLNDYPGLTMQQAEKVASSAIAPLVQAARPYTEVTDDASYKEAVKVLGIPRRTTGQGKRYYAATETGGVLNMLWYTPDDVALAERAGVEAKPSTIQFRPARPEKDEDGRERKYEFCTGHNTPVGMHPAIPPSWIDHTKKVLIAEGLLKGDSALTAFLLAHGATPEDLSWDGTGTVADARARLRALLEAVPDDDQVLILAIAGVYNWKKNPEWHSMNLAGREVWLGVDGDVSSNHMVRRAMGEAWSFLRDKHRATPYLLAPVVNLPDGVKKVGIDDFHAEYGGWNDLLQMKQDHLPEPPTQHIDADLLAMGPGANILRADSSRGVTVRVRLEGVVDPFSGDVVSFKEITTPVLDACIEILSTKMVSEGYGKAKRRTVLHRLRVTIPDTPPVLVEDWRDEDLNDIEGILRQAGAVHVTWHETSVPFLFAQLRDLIRKSLAEDYRPSFAMKRLGLVMLPHAHWADAADRDESDLLVPDASKKGIAWIWVNEDGAVGPEWMSQPDAHAEVGEGIGDRFDIPDWQSPVDSAADIRLLLDEVMAAYNDPTLRYLHNAKWAGATAGIRSGGYIYGSANPGTGKSKDGEFTNGLAFGKGEPLSVVNDTGNYLPGLADDRSTTITIAGDVKRMKGDEKSWPGTAKAVTNFLRRDIDGPGAARGRLGGAEQGYKAAKRNQAYPGSILDGELHPFWDESTMTKGTTYRCADDYVRKGFARKVIEHHANRGLPSRLGRGFTAWVVTSIPLWLDGEQTIDGLSMLHKKELDRMCTDGEYFAASYKVSAEMFAVVSDWTSRSQTNFAALVRGHRLLSTWMRDVALRVGDADLTEKVRAYYREGLVKIFKACQKHVLLTRSEGAYDPIAATLGRVGTGLADGRGWVAGDGLTKETTHSILVGKKYDNQHYDLMLGNTARAFGIDEDELRTAFQSVAIKSGDTYIHKVWINGVKQPVYRIPTASVRGDSEEGDVSIEDEIAYYESQLDRYTQLIEAAEKKQAAAAAADSEREAA